MAERDVCPFGALWRQRRHAAAERLTAALSANAANDAPSRSGLDKIIIHLIMCIYRCLICEQIS